MDEKYFLSNLNTTLTSLRRQLTTNGYATAHTSFNGEFVWGLASCRGYLSIPDCLDCFDDVVELVKQCGPAVGVTVIYSDCDVRYENNNFFTDPKQRFHTVLCDNITSPQPKEFRKAVKKLLRDLTAATPKTSNLYAASNRQEGDGNATAYAIAQCNLNVRQSVCLECLNSRSLDLDNCLPAISGRAMDTACFIRYSSTPFFGQNQTSDISSLLWDDDLNKKRSIIGGVVGGVGFLLILLAMFLWCGRLKKIGRDQQDAPALNGAVNYSYRQLQLATNNFSEENIIGKGGFGEVYKRKQTITFLHQLKHAFNPSKSLPPAVLDDNKVVAVKKLKVGYIGAKSGFENEILLISLIRHRNLLRLLGSSEGSDALLLVLEYMPNGSLDRGYTAPEYLLYGSLSDKVDTFSFGIVTLEIISGRRCAYRNFDGPSTDCLLEHVRYLFLFSGLL
ncbi:cysteine-rich receptor-like protein kinase [Artemisia annua]|uniref:Cysteine-rich receptor-like protein kinase n=1 Tax=Artemisia annua TaxID=35608 RepID=A0A2U1MS10_ARTAN|nr:cysteine-rich receptor-like protein kinase [Artemisia annua]